ncbi:hypothetical protein TTHERM_00891290 (macronuclear) [Tetrahymena thermophila SB210]|uniref:Uncharacterized protein n=1 Tax=Tetrahymena thermophila (strain SB210) TaxID=312017 RepID=Q23U68_TETTS|nr:hypothetical protein TTHERM_00891290 [Tetrahymena thermophila SB210]EAS00076.2 hypothetical protein TTHERM_00891290 [Tetrahymena thermophila SB210]|eukprot:XP_001020321.2 hypothetical protein TTHERM_00891290 [Tetrahymena thermophila SB210]
MVQNTSNFTCCKFYAKNYTQLSLDKNLRLKFRICQCTCQSLQLLNKDAQFYAEKYADKSFGK